MFRTVAPVVAVAMTLALPAAALADKPAAAGHGKGHAEHKHSRKPLLQRHGPARPGAPVVVGGAHPVVVPGGAPVVVGGTGNAAHCPPGLAKKSPACVPPGQAKKRGYRVGDVIAWDRAHVVNRPGLYGLGEAPAGQRYAIVNGRLVRVDRDTGRILSVLSMVDAILD